MDVANRPPGKPGPAERAATAEKNRIAGSCGVAIMAKASAPGQTKTRLVPPLTFEQAAALNTAFLQDVAGNLLLAGSYASDCRLRRFRASRDRGVFPRHVAVRHRPDRCIPTEFRRLLAAHDRGNICPRTCLGGRPQF